MSIRFAITAALVCVLGAGCAFSKRTQLPRSASQQMLATEAVVRALEQFEFPDIKGKKVMVHVGAPGDAVDTDFLKTTVQRELFEEGAKVAGTPEQADLVLAMVVGSMGLNIRGASWESAGAAG